VWNNYPDHISVPRSVFLRAIRRFGAVDTWVGKWIVGAGAWRSSAGYPGSFTSVKYVGDTKPTVSPPPKGRQG
jgi:hypothetical protein